jgi:hypothetical protein
MYNQPTLKKKEKKKKKKKKKGEKQKSYGEHVGNISIICSWLVTLCTKDYECLHVWFGSRVCLVGLD